MSDANIPDLLEELREVDETTWAKIQYGVVFGKGLDESRVPYESMGVQMAHDHLQGCIQRAIAARGWEYQVAYNPHIGPDDRHGQAYIWPLGEVTKCYESEEDTPAVAILAAYIEAVRASK